MTKKILFSAALLGAVTGLIAGASSAQAFDLSFVGGVDFATPAVQVNGSDTYTYSSKTGFGGGALFGFDLNMVTELEIGTLYMSRHTTGPSGEHNYFNYQIPVVLRLIPLKYITIGLGPCYSIPTGNDSDPGVQATSEFQNDFGVLGSASLKFPLALATSFLVDARYLYGITNASKMAGTTLHYRDLQILAGLDFDF